MELRECIRRDRATRAFTDEPVSDDDIRAIIDLARKSGSGKNRQPWSFIVVRERERLDELASFGEYTTPLRRAPVGIVVLMDVREGGGQMNSVFDCGRAFQNMKLATTDLGLGSVPQGIDGEQAEEVLNVPGTKNVVIGLALGYPAGDDDTIEGVDKKDVLERMERAHLDELIHWETHR